MNKRRRFKRKRLRYIAKLAQQVLMCPTCEGAGEVTLPDTDERLVCPHCEGSGSEPTWQYAAVLEWVLFGTYQSKTVYESHPKCAACAADWLSGAAVDWGAEPAWTVDLAKLRDAQRVYNAQQSDIYEALRAIPTERTDH